MASRDKVADAEELKAQGNKHLSAKDFDKAIEFYNEAIKLHESHVYFSNRSAAYLSKGFADSALKDALKCIELNPQFSKGYSRKGAALHHLRKYDEAISAYEQGLQIDPTNAGLTSGLENVQAEKSGPPSYSGPPGGGGADPLGGLFGPGFMEKVKSNPKTAGFCDDPSFMQMLQMVSTNPQMIQVLMKDERFQVVMEEILGVSMQGAPPPGPTKTPEEKAAEEKERKEQEELKKLLKEEADRKKAEEEEAARLAAESPEERQKRENKEKATTIKETGNGHYKKKEFEAALECYNKAIELDPEQMLYFLNIASVKLEQGDLEACIKQCEKSIEVGKSVYAPYETVAKAYVRMGNAYTKHQKFAEALEKYQQAQLEHKRPEVANKIKALEVRIKKEAARTYINPELAAKAKEEGNVLFKAGDFPGSIKHYTEAVKRDPINAVYYGNRAAAYMKCADFGRAMDDCEKALELDPKYVKMHVRKGNITLFLKEYHKSIKSYQAALDLEPTNQEAIQGMAKTQYAIQSGTGDNDQERRARAMEDPEIQGIMADPVMQQVLRDLSTDPSSARNHLSNPEVAKKIETLIAAGVIQTK